MEFKVGDKVVLIDNNHMSQGIGATGVVVGIRKFGDLSIVWDNPKYRSGEWIARRFELVPVVPDKPEKTCANCMSLEPDSNRCLASAASYCVDEECCTDWEPRRENKTPVSVPKNPNQGIPLACECGGKAFFWSSRGAVGYEMGCPDCGTVYMLSGDNIEIKKHK